MPVAAYWQSEVERAETELVTAYERVESRPEGQRASQVLQFSTEAMQLAVRIRFARNKLADLKREGAQ